MGPDIEKLMRWFDKKTGYGYDHEGWDEYLLVTKFMPRTAEALSQRQRPGDPVARNKDFR